MEERNQFEMKELFDSTRLTCNHFHFGGYLARDCATFVGVACFGRRAVPQVDLVFVNLHVLKLEEKRPGLLSK